MFIKITGQSGPELRDFDMMRSHPGVWQTLNSSILFVVNSTHVVAVSEGGFTVLNPEANYHGWNSPENKFFKSKKKIKFSN